MGYTQLTSDQRCQIYTLNKIGKSQTLIAKELGVHKSTICRELARNKGERGYRHKQANERALKRRREATKAIKMTEAVIELIECRIREQWSPEQVSGWLEKDCTVQVSHERIYQHIWEDKHSGGDLYTHLRRNGKKYNKRSSGKTSRGQIKNRVGIEQRPSIVDKKKRTGDWEIDTVIGKGHKGALVTIVERKTRYTVSKRVSSKEASKVTEATIELLEPLKHRVHTITADNGKEFASHEQIAQALDAKVYFARPYHSWERGLNENTNGLLRQYFPKNTDFTSICDDQVAEAVRKLNERPRKIMGFKTPKQMLERSLSKAA